METISSKPEDTPAILVTGDASRAASMILDMAAYCSTQGYDGFYQWLAEHHGRVEHQVVKKNMNGLIKQLQKLLFTVSEET